VHCEVLRRRAGNDGDCRHQKERPRGEPPLGVGEAKVQTPGAEMRCGKEGYCAECGETKWSDKTGVVPVMRGLDPRIHLLRKMFLRRWMDCRVKPGNDSEGV